MTPNIFCSLILSASAPLRENFFNLFLCDCFLGLYDAPVTAAGESLLVASEYTDEHLKLFVILCG